MIDNKTFSKTRIAPTPSGFVHLGNVFSFGITAALAEKTGAEILLRIDDMDRERVDPAYVQDIFDTLNFLDIPWQAGPRNHHEFEQYFSQRHRLPLYNRALQQLRDEEKVFACTCSRAQLSARNVDGKYPGTCIHKNISLDAVNVSWRIKSFEGDTIKLNTLKGPQAVAMPDNMQNFVVRKKDGFPAYQLTSVIDDLYFGVDLIVRGQDLWDSTIAQAYLANILGRDEFKTITFFHHPLLRTRQGDKLSKSAGDTSIQFLRKNGKSPTEIFELIGSMLKTSQPVSHWRDFLQAIESPIR